MTTSAVPSEQSTHHTRAPGLADHHETLAAVDQFFGGFCLLIIVTTALGWLRGDFPAEAPLAVFGFFVANATISVASQKMSSPARVEKLRILVGTFIAPGAYLLVRGPLIAWWPGFLIMALGGAIVIGLLTGQAKWGAGLVGFHLLLYTLTWWVTETQASLYLVVMNGGVIAMVGLLFAKVMSLVGASAQTIERSREELAHRAELLARASQYKSEFLANMSHELRTPLNSLLILSNKLRQNEAGHLDEREVVYAKTIHDAGGELLGLINDILDLSKVEAGAMEVYWSEVELGEIERYIQQTFAHVAEAQDLAFSLLRSPNLPKTITTDEHRLRQVLRNLLSNAFKFTIVGEVCVFIRTEPSLDESSPDGELAIEIRDTGIGIPIEEQHLIFEPFHQADAGTSREYGGTGLGLSICRDFARLLGGRVQVESVPGEGSTFTLLLPVRRTSISSLPAGPTQPSEPPLVDVDQFALGSPRAWLYFGTDSATASLVDELAREQGHHFLRSDDASVTSHLLQRNHVTLAVVDARSSSRSSWVFLDRIHRDPRLRFIRSIVLATANDRLRAFESAASRALIGSEGLDECLRELGTARHRSKVVFVGDEAGCDAVAALVERTGLSAVPSAEELDESAGCVIWCTTADTAPPAVVRTALRQGIPVLHRMDSHHPQAPPMSSPSSGTSPRILVLRDDDHLLDLATRIFCVPAEELGLEGLEPSRHRRVEDLSYLGLRVLVIDDDMRNVFAVTTVLESHGIEVSFATGGHAGLEVLERDPNIDILLTDTMMPELDGYEVTRRVRANPATKDLPIIAVTARAMAGDRQKCLEVGASDYLPKPIEEQTLLSLLWIWGAHRRTRDGAIRLAEASSWRNTR